MRKSMTYSQLVDFFTLCDISGDPIDAGRYRILLSTFETLYGIEWAIWLQDLFYKTECGSYMLDCPSYEQWEDLLREYNEVVQKDNTCMSPYISRQLRHF